MLELTNEQKIQILENRRMIIARNKFELEVDILVMTTQGRTEDIAVLTQRIEELRLSDIALYELMITL